MRDTVKVVILLSMSFIMVTVETWLKGIVPISGLLAVMSMGIMINRKYPILAKRITGKFGKLWVVAEIMLFVLVGASVNIQYALNAGISTIILINVAVSSTRKARSTRPQRPSVAPPASTPVNTRWTVSTTTIRASRCITKSR